MDSPLSLLPCLVAKLLELTALNLEADAGRLVGVSLCLKGSLCWLGSDAVTIGAVN